MGEKYVPEEAKKGILSSFGKKARELGAIMGIVAGGEAASANLPKTQPEGQTIVYDYKKNPELRDPNFDGMGLTNESGDHPSVDLQKADEADKKAAEEKENNPDTLARK